MTNTCSEILYRFCIGNVYNVCCHCQYGVAQLVTDPTFADTTTIKKNPTNCNFGNTVFDQKYTVHAVWVPNDCTDSQTNRITKGHSNV